MLNQCAAVEAVTVLKYFFGTSLLPGRTGADQMIRRRRLFSFTSLFLFAAAQFVRGQVPDNLLSDLRWRDVGPMRGGRTFAVAEFT